MHTFNFQIRPKPYERIRIAKGFAYNSKKYSGYKQTLALMASTQFNQTPLEGPLFVDILFSFKRPKKTNFDFPPKSDLDNLFKAVGDALNKVVWKDDSQIAGMHTSKHWASEDSIKLEVYSAHEMMEGSC